MFFMPIRILIELCCERLQRKEAGGAILRASPAFGMIC